MPNITMTFTLPEEQNELRLAEKGGDFFCALWDIAEKIRQMRKWEQGTPSDVIDYIETRIYESGVDEIE